jgi:hypothetical protein
MTDFPVMKGNAAMARGASYFEVPLFSHVIDNLWQGCSPAEFPDELENLDWRTHEGQMMLRKIAREPINCKWLYEAGLDNTEDGPIVNPTARPRFDKMLNLYPWGEYNVPEGTEKIDVLAYDGAEVDFNTFEQAADLVIDWLNEGQKVLVHCQAGLNRSSFVVARVLMRKYGMTADQAIDLIREKRSNMCLCNDAFRAYLKGLK